MFCMYCNSYLLYFVFLFAPFDMPYLDFNNAVPLLNSSIY